MSHVWLVALPNQGRSTFDTCGLLKHKLGLDSRAAEDHVTVIDVPQDLRVGTLDTLMALSDEMNRTDLAIEHVVKKVERQYWEVAGPEADPLQVFETDPLTFCTSFNWDFARYSPRMALPELVSQIQMNVVKVDEELRQLSNQFTDKLQTLTALKRRKTGNLATIELSEVLNDEVLAGHDIITDSAFLVTLLVVMPSHLEQEWQDTYESLGADIAAFGGRDWTNQEHRVGDLNAAEYGPETGRTARRGSPVVPGSSRKLLQEGDQCMYSVTVLKGHFEAGQVDEDEYLQGIQTDYIEPFKVAAREKRFIVRDFEYDPDAGASLEDQFEALQVEVQYLTTAMIRWCRTHFGDTFSAWVHLKMVRCFVECVLRYGLPRDFSLMLVQQRKLKDKTIETAAKEAYVDIVGESHQDHLYGGGEEEEAGVSVPGMEAEEYLPFVSHKFTIPG